MTTGTGRGPQPFAKGPLNGARAAIEHIDPGIAGGEEYHRDLSMFDIEDGAQPEVGFGIADPALTDVKSLSHQESKLR